MSQLKALKAKARNKEMSDSWADVDISTFIQKHSCQRVFDMSKNHFHVHIFVLFY